MKKLFSFFLALSIVFSFSSCTTHEQNENDSFSNHSSTTQTAESDLSDTKTETNNSTSSHLDESISTNTDSTDTTPSNNQDESSASDHETQKDDPCANGHNFSSNTIKSTCIAKGCKIKTCTVCGKTETEDLPLGEHYRTTSYKKLNVSQHQTIAKCSICKDEIIKAENHTWGQWTTVQDPTTTSAGQKTRQCTLCGQSVAESIPILTPTPQQINQRILELVNIERQKAGVSPLQYYDAGQSAANVRADEIVTYFSHTRPDGSSCFTALDQDHINYWTAGENIAMGYTTPESVMEGWMNSAGHKENILNANFTHIIIGYRADQHAWVQLFLGL